MDQRTKPPARIAPLPPEHSPELREPIAIGEKFFAKKSWSVGKYAS